MYHFGTDKERRIRFASETSGLWCRTTLPTQGPTALWGWHWTRHTSSIGARLFPCRVLPNNRFCPGLYQAALWPAWVSDVLSVGEASCISSCWFWLCRRFQLHHNVLLTLICRYSARSWSCSSPSSSQHFLMPLLLEYTRSSSTFVASPMVSVSAFHNCASFLTCFWSCQPWMLSVSGVHQLWGGWKPTWEQRCPTPGWTTSLFCTSTRTGVIHLYWLIAWTTLCSAASIVFPYSVNSEHHLRDSQWYLWTLADILVDISCNKALELHFVFLQWMHANAWLYAARMGICLHANGWYSKIKLLYCRSGNIPR